MLFFGVLAWSGSLLINQVTALGPAITGSYYRLYETSNSVSPGTPLAATGASAQLSTKGQTFRLRTGLTTRPHAVELNIVEPGYHVSCALVSGLPYCSGQATNGELGSGNRTSTQVYTPVDMSTGLAGKTITDFAIGSLSSTITVCAVADGELYCWGSNYYGTLGINQTRAAVADSVSPVKVILDGTLTGHTVSSVDAGDGHICATTTNGKAVCWGTNGSGRLGDNGSSQRNKPYTVVASGVLAGKTVTKTAAGSSSTCAIASGKAYCWGDNTYGAIGDNSTTPSAVPVAVDDSGVLAGKTLVDIGIALSTACALDTTGKVYCWGRNAAGEIGNNTNIGSLIPLATDMSLVTGGAFTSITAKHNNLCGIGAANSKVYCWGQNQFGATGRNTSSGQTLRPSEVTSSGFLSGKTVTSITTGRYTACGIASGEGFCFGYNESGGLGLNNVTQFFSTAQAMRTNEFTPAQGVTVASSTIGTRLEFAQKTVGSCSAQTGFQAVTTNTAIAWSTNPSVASGTAITATGNDPISGSNVVVQRYVSATSDLNNPQAIAPGETGLWDFSLKDNSGKFNQAYCLRLAQSNGTAYASYVQYPEIVTAEGILSVDILDVSDEPVATPGVTLPTAQISTSCQTVTGTLGTSSQKIRVSNDTTSASWVLDIAPTNGSTAAWQHTTEAEGYDFNDSSGSPAGCNSGLDGDGMAGQLTVNPSVGGSLVQAKSGCTLTGITKGSSQAFSEGVIDAIVLLDASGSANTECYWDMTGIGISQTVPARQPGGSYTIDMTLTVLAQ